MNIIQKIYEKYFSEKAIENRRQNKAAKLKMMFERDYAKLSRKKVSEQLRSEIRQYQIKARGTSTIHKVGREFGGLLNFMAQNYHSQSKPYRHKKKSRRYYDAPLAFSMLPLNIRRR